MQVPKPKTYRNKKYLDFVRSLPCSYCFLPAPSDPHHVSLNNKGFGMKVPDTQVIPLCRI